MIKLFSLFSGYGGAEFGLAKAGIPYECVGFSEIDKGAIKCYEQNFPNVKNYGDITKIKTEDFPDFDLLTGGFPCQDVSIAGNRDLSKGRTNLYQEILRIAKDKKPRFMLLENVKGLLSMEVDEQKLVNIIVRDLQKLGYGVCWKVLNSKDYGIPQNRERVWFVCKLGGWEFMEFQFPEKEPLKIFVKDILEKEVDKKYFLSENAIKRITERENTSYQSKIDPDICNTIRTNYSGSYSNETIIGGLQEHQTPRTDGVSPSLTTAMGTGGGHIPLIKIDRSFKGQREIDTNGIMSTLVLGQTQNDFINTKTRDFSLVKKYVEERFKDSNNPIQVDLYHLFYGEIRPLSTYIPQNELVYRCLQAGIPKEIIFNGVWRYLTPRECFRLMGFLNDEIKIDGLSDTQKYKLAGNGWEINVASKIFKKMKKSFESIELKGGNEEDGNKEEV